MIKDVVEEAIEDKLDNNHFPFLGGQRQRSSGAAPTSARYGAWHKDKKDQTAAKTVPRIIVFMVGGTSYSEMRAAYEVTNDKKNWEIIMGELCFKCWTKVTLSRRLLNFFVISHPAGGSHLMTPEKFLDIVKEVNCSEKLLSNAKLQKPLLSVQVGSTGDEEE